MPTFALAICVASSYRISWVFSPAPRVGSFLQVEQKEAGVGYQRDGMAFREEIKSVWILQPQKEMAGVHMVKP